MSVLLASHINAVLTEAVADEVGGRIFLEGADNEVQLPYIVYGYSVLSANATKDIIMCDTCDVDISIYDRDGVSSLELAEDVRHAFQETATAEYPAYSVIDTEFGSYNGQLVEGIYIRTLRFTIKTQS